MTKIKNILKAILPFLSAFFLPIISLISIWVISYFVIGSSQKLFGDWEHQNIEFLSFFKSIFSGQNNLFGTFNIAGGTNAYSIFFSYMSSPFNLVSLFFPTEQLTIASFIIILLKIGTAGLTFYIYIHKTFQKMRPSASILFVLAWTLSSFIVSYCWLTMWLDSIILLPIVCLGINHIIQGKSTKTYFFSLAFAILFNFYTAWMLCLFSVLWFLYKLTNQMPKINKQAFAEHKKTIYKFLFSSLFAGLLNAVVIIPVALNIMQNTNRISFFDASSTKYSFFDIIKQLTFGSYDINGYHFIEGYPNIFIGTITIFFTTLYFLNKNIDKKTKITSLLFLLILLFSLYIPALRTIWHAGTVTAWYPCRFAFLFSFLLINLAIESYMTPTSQNFPILGMFFLVAYLFLVYDFSPDTNIAIRIAVPLLIMSLFLFINKFCHSSKKILFVFLQCLELILNGALLWSQEITDIAMDSEQTIQEISHSISSDLEATNYITTQDSGFYRTINTNTPFYNWSLFTNSYSMSGFSSTLNFKKIISKTNLIDIDDSWVATDNSTASTEVDKLFGIKYFIINNDEKLQTATLIQPEEQELTNVTFSSTTDLKAITEKIFQYDYSEKEYEKLYSNSEYTIYKNTSALEIGFTIKNEFVESLDTLIDHVDEAHNNGTFKLECSSKIQGNIEVAENEIIVFSIPFDNGWSAKIDGVPTVISNVADGLIGISTTSGTHTVELSYVPQGFKIGAIISGLSILTIASHFMYIKNKK